MRDKKRLGDAPERLFDRPKTGADALAAAIGAAPPPATSRREKAEKGEWAVTTIRLTREQWRWLREQATARALAHDTRADASEILRELIDRAMAAREKTPS